MSRFNPCLAAALAAGLAVFPAVAEEYLLGPQDRVRLKVYEWRASRDAIFEWTALNDQFTVGADGSLFLPFVGEIQAEGVRLGDLAGVIGQRLVQQMGLGRAPDVALEVVQFRPFYIVGDVMQPGEFPYRPGLTVLQALTIAGGLRTREDGSSRFEREVIAGQSDVDLLALSKVSLVARKARLEAELGGADQIAFPPLLTDRQGNATIATMMEQERVVFEARKQGISTQLRALSELRSFLEKEIASLETQLTFQDQQIELVKKELSGVSTLVDQGLAVAPREMSLERSLLEMQSGRLSAETALLRARQEMSRTDISILELRNQHANEAAAQLRETEAQLNEVNRREDTAVMLLHESESVAPRLLALRAEAAKAQPVLTIVHRSGEQTTETAATEATQVLPGDTVKVEIPLPEGLDAFPATTGAPLSALPASGQVSVLEGTGAVP
jgi:polysaccharide export outer membrane protein/exopolysaccharide production protein ExoF